MKFDAYLRIETHLRYNSYLKLRSYKPEAVKEAPHRLISYKLKYCMIDNIAYRIIIQYEVSMMDISGRFALVLTPEGCQSVQLEIHAGESMGVEFCLSLAKKEQRLKFKLTICQNSL